MNNPINSICTAQCAARPSPALKASSNTLFPGHCPVQYSENSEAPQRINVTMISFRRNFGICVMFQSSVNIPMHGHLAEGRVSVNHHGEVLEGRTVVDGVGAPMIVRNILLCHKWTPVLARNCRTVRSRLDLYLSQWPKTESARREPRTEH